MEYKSINLEEKCSLFDELWKPETVAELNDHQFDLIKIKGDFVWHVHQETEKAFLVLSGELRIDFRDGHIIVREGELFIVPKGVEHKPSSEMETKLMLIGPK